MDFPGLLGITIYLCKYTCIVLVVRRWVCCPCPSSAGN